MIAIIDYGAGNTRSVRNALTRLNVESCLTDNPQILREADRIIFPGVGEASTAMNTLQERQLDQVIKELTQPVLGICLGLQLLCEYSDEGDTPGLGIFDTNVRLFPPEQNVPHVGWNNCIDSRGKLFEGISESDDFYFVHSYYAEQCTETNAVCDYILPFSAALTKNNFNAVQFHPEKSAKPGETLLKNFLTL